MIGHHVSYIIAALAYKELITVKYYIMSNQFTFITGAALFNLAVLNYANPMPPALYNLKCRAIQERAYVHPG